PVSLDRSDSQEEEEKAESPERNAEKRPSKRNA
ncbi:unnamed protein product, partial [marine sediment metagenome]